MSRNASKNELLTYILGYKAAMWVFDSEDYRYWADYLSELSKQDLIEELEDHYLIERV
jgi:hypothetical protein